MEKLQPSLPQGWNSVDHAHSEWNVYRTRFLIKARRLTEPVVFVDFFGREHRGSVGDYLVESSDGSRRIAAREIFEDIYVVMENGPPVPARAKLARSRKPASATMAVGMAGNRPAYAAESPNSHH